jgi:hypothetical protein
MMKQKRLSHSCEPLPEINLQSFPDSAAINFNHSGTKQELSKFNHGYTDRKRIYTEVKSEEKKIHRGDAKDAKGETDFNLTIWSFRL